MMTTQDKTGIQRVLETLMQPTHTKKFLFFMVVDTAIIVFSLAVSFLLRLDFDIQDPSYYLFPRTAVLFVGIKLLSFIFFKLYQLSWRFVSLKDLANIAKAVFFSSFALTLVLFFFRIDYFFGFPRSVLVIDAILTLLLVSLVRISKRVFLELLLGARKPKGKRTIIAGAGNTGEMILRDLKRSGFAEYAPVAFLDDDTNRVGTYLHGIKVMGQLKDLSTLIATYRIEALIIAIPALAHKRLRELYTLARTANIKEIKIVPRLYDFSKPEMRVQELEDIKIEDLIGRQAISVNYDEIGRAFAHRNVLVTGAAGSIGFEIVKQLCRFNPRELVLFEIDETELYKVDLAVRQEFPSMAERLRVVVGDVRDKERLEQVFRRFAPEVVFHAAAYKHVPMMEFNASEAVKVNIMGTYNVAEMASRHGVSRFVMISTDKAVRPTSIMGATKRFAEGVCSAFNAECQTEYLAVRFGNVLGSRGSVLPLFLEQIQRGGPITITHQDMQRYFMTIPEAVSLVLQASVIGRGGDIMVLDMGEPVKIVDLAEELLRVHGLKPHEDIAIQFIGMRPGEKLFEETLTAEEGTVATRHEKVFIARNQDKRTRAEVETALHALTSVLAKGDFGAHEIKKILKQQVRWYDGDASDSAIPQNSSTQLISVPKNAFRTNRASGDVVF